MSFLLWTLLIIYCIPGLFGTVLLAGWFYYSLSARNQHSCGKVLYSWFFALLGGIVWPFWLIGYIKDNKVGKTTNGDNAGEEDGP